MRLVNFTGRALPILVEDPDGPLEGAVWGSAVVRQSRFRLLCTLSSVNTVSLAAEEKRRVVLAGTQLGDVEIAEVRLGQAIGLPDQVAHVLLIVPSLVAMAYRARARDDLLVIHERVRDSAGRELGVLSFGKFTGLCIYCERDPCECWQEVDE